MAFNYLTLPLRIEGKFLFFAEQVSSPLADFSKLPWYDTTKSRDENFSQPFLADGIIHEPFSGANLLLEKGLHLHFIIPHYLGQHVPQKCGTPLAGQLPPAPNRWLITKKENGSVVKQWIIESDYIHNETYVPTEAQCIIPYNQGKPFRYMGRKTLLTDSRSHGDTFRSLSGKALTVVGYGDINFSSFYPNCLGVFGFYDEDAELNNNLSYSILGWNDNPNDDLLNSVLTNLFQSNSSISLESINKQLSDLFKLNIEASSISLDSSNLPRTIFYGEINADNCNPDQLDLSSLELSIGHTGPEALSALLAESFSSDSVQKTLIEEQLESVLMNAQLEHLLTDFGPKFLEARHEKGFRAIHAGNIWKLTVSNTTTSSTASDVFNTVELPDDLALLLNELNLAQQNYDKAISTLIDLKEQLYLDWNKYMHARYPPLGERGAHLDADHVMYFLQNYSFTEIEELSTNTGIVTYGDQSESFCPTPGKMGTNDLANALNASWNAVNTLLTTENASRVAANQKPIELVLSIAPAYWASTPPVVLLSGLANGSMENEDVTATIAMANLISSTQTLDEQAIASSNPNDVLVQLNGKNAKTLSEQSSNPFILDWEVDLLHAKIHDANNAISSNAIQENFVIDQFGPDLQKGNYNTGKLSVLSGSVLLSSHAGVAFQNQIENFFKTHFSKNGVTYVSGSTLGDFLNANKWDDAFKLLIIPNKYTAITTSEDFIANPHFTIWSAYKKLLSQNVLSQTLSGFNEACAMRKKVTQLPIQEPIGFEYAKSFTNNVKGYVGEYKTSSPILGFDFNPIYSGNMKLNRLSLIDNFGVAYPIQTETTKTVVANSLDDGTGSAFLNPRFSQAARLNFRWLSANGEMEMNDHPASSPVVGWLMANYLNGTIAVFDTEGNALGYIDENNTWTLPPWVNGIANVQTNISNTYLQNVVNKLCSDNSFFADFLTASQEALNNIAPPDANLYSTKATLMGRPMAVIRTQLSFEVKGEPAISQSWSSLIMDLNNSDGNAWKYSNRDNANWTSLKLPVRLGEHAQLNDGLIGYWTEETNGTLDKFIAPETSSADVSAIDGNIDAFSDTNFQTQWLALNDDPLNITMLIDPTAKVHATTGILPVKSIILPPEQYMNAMSKIALWFDTSYLIQPAELSGLNVTIDLPPVSGYQWNWWDPFYGNQTIIKDSKQQTNIKAQAMDGWLVLSPNNTSTK